MSRLSTTDRCTGRDADLATVQIALAASSTPEAITCRLLALGGANCLLPVHRAIESHVHTSSSHVYAVDESNDATSALGYEDPEQTRFGALECTRATGAFYLTLVPIRPRWRGERRSLRTFVRSWRVSPPTPRFQSRHTSTPFNSASDAFRLHPDVRSYGTTLTARTLVGLARDRAWLSPTSFRDAVERELVHALAVRPRTNSELRELIPSHLASEQARDRSKTDFVSDFVSQISSPAAPTDRPLFSRLSFRFVSFDRPRCRSTARRDAQGDVDDVLSAVATYTPPRGADDHGKYELKRDAWGKFDAFFHRYSPTDLEHACANAIRAWREEARARPMVSQREEDIEPEPEPEPSLGGTRTVPRWSPRALLRAPDPTPRAFASLLRFASHPSIARFVRDCVCALASHPDSADLQDTAVSAMSLCACAVRGGGEKTDEKTDETEVRSLHWFPYDPVREVDADP